MDSSKNVDRSTIRLFWQTSLREKRLLLLTSAHSISAICLSTLVPLLIGKMLASLLLPAGQPLSYLPWLLAAASLGIVGNLVGFRALMKVQGRGACYLQQRALDTLLKRSVGFHNNNVGGKLVSDAIDFPNSYLQIAGAFFINLVPFVVVLVSGSVIIFTQSWVLGLIIVVMSVLTLGAGIWDRYQRKELRQRQITATKAVTSHLADTIVNVQTVKTFARESTELTNGNRLSHMLLNARLGNWIPAGTHGSYRVAMLLAMQIGLVIATVKLVQHDPQVLAAGIFAFSFTIMLGTRLFEVNSLLKTIDEALLNASPMTEILLEEPEILDKRGAQTLKVKKGKISLKDVGFHYPDSSSGQTVFSKLNINIKPGEKVGLVGPSGGGKSTLTRLLLRFEDVDSGEILIDGQNIAELTQTSLRQAIAYVPQEPLLFHRTIRENIAYGNLDANDKAVSHAAHLAYADEFIHGLPQGYNTIVGERGVKLSGGQRQRIAIARAILKDAPILVLDEATSALDSESEVLIQKALRELMKDRTTLVIAHRLSTIQKMDRIIVLKDGAITEEGTHEALRRKKGLYAKLWTHQSGGFIEE